MKFGVVVFPGSNCDHDMMYLLKHILKQEVVPLWHKDSDLQNCDCIVLPGGFSYGDYLRSGALASISTIMSSVIDFANKGGLVIGICNGFQILCEAKLLPGALLHNESRKFICKNVYLQVETTKTRFTSLCKEKQTLCIPIAHGEGNFYADPKTIAELEKNDQILFRYCTEKGEVSPEANPNGALGNIAGICNQGRNVFGMMPHPERCSDTALLNTDGRVLFESILKA